LKPSTINQFGEQTMEKHNGSKLLPSVCILTAGCLWGTIGVFVKALSHYGITSMQITFLRALVTAVVLVLFLLITDRKKLKISIRDMWCFVGTGLCSIVFFNFCYFQTILLTSLSVAAILLYTAPIFVMLLSAVLFHERLTFKKIFALLLAFCGCILVSGAVGGKTGAISPFSLLLGLGSGFGYALYSIFGRYALRRYGTATVTAYTFVFAAVGSLPFIGAPGLFQTIQQSPQSLVPTVLMGLLTSTVPFVLYTAGLKSVQSGKASIIACVEPAVAAIIGILFYQEPFTPTSAAGTLLVLSAIVLLSVRFPYKKQTSQ
jgi:Predicted permease, DMT superfamily